MDDDQLPVPRRPGGVFPISRQALRPPPAPLGIPLLAEARNWSERKQHESLAKLDAVINARLGLMLEQEGLLVRLAEWREIAAGRLGKLPTLRAMEEQRIEDEWDAMRDASRARKLRSQIEIMMLERELIEARRIRDEAENPQAPQAPPTLADRLREAFAKNDEIEAMFRARQQAIIEAAGGEENLTDEDRRRIDQLEVEARVLSERLTSDLL